jgi:MarR-like DNA-binding transcriptional regulator SgrR of sgrS sRNA
MDNLLNKRYGPGADMDKDILEGHMVDRWSHAPDYSYSDYHIRPEIYFHDVAPVNGRLCTAEDVKYCLEVYQQLSLAKAALEIIDRIEILPDKETLGCISKSRLCSST